MTLLARIYATDGQPDKAGPLFEKIVKQEPKNLAHRIVLASFYTSQNQIDKGEKVLRDGVVLDPENIKPKLILVDYLVNKVSKEKAEAQLIEYIQAEPKAWDLRFGLGKLYTVDNKPEKAREVYEAIIELDEEDGPQALKARNKLARLALQEGDVEGRPANRQRDPGEEHPGQGRADYSR